MSLFSPVQDISKDEYNVYKGKSLSFEVKNL